MAVASDGVLAGRRADGWGCRCRQLTLRTTIDGDTHGRRTSHGRWDEDRSERRFAPEHALDRVDDAIEDTAVTGALDSHEASPWRRGRMTIHAPCISINAVRAGSVSSVGVIGAVATGGASPECINA